MRRLIMVLGHSRGYLRKEGRTWIWRRDDIPQQEFFSIPGARLGIAEHYGVSAAQVSFHIA